MSNFWKDKWAKAQRNWEELRTKADTPSDVIAGLTPLAPRSFAAPKVSKDFRQLLKNGNVGRSILMTGGPGSAEVVSLLDVRGPDEYAQVVTVTLDGSPLDRPDPF